MRCLDDSNQQEVMLIEELDGAINPYALKIDNLCMLVGFIGDR